MEVKHKIEIALLRFIKTGEFDFVKIGDSKEKILHKFPAPDDFGIGSTLNTAKIWRYGNIEFHFVDNRLTSIFSDRIADINGGKSIILNKWIFDHTKKLELTQFISSIIQEKIDFDLRHLKSTGQISIMVSTSNVEILFDRSDDHNDVLYLLSSFCLTKK